MKLRSLVISKTELQCYVSQFQLSCFCKRTILGSGNILYIIAHRNMNVGIGKEAAQLHFWEYINWIFGSVRKIVALYINFAILAVIAAKNFT